MKSIAYLAFCLSAFILLVSVAGFYFHNRILQEKDFYSSVKITQRGGFDVNSSALTFGEISGGGSSLRNVIIQNGYSFPVNAQVTCDGTICSMLTYEKTTSLVVGENKKIPFLVRAKQDNEKIFYNGTIHINLLAQ